MPTNRQRTAVFPGAFDPITNGHLDLIRRGRILFDKLIVAVGRNPEKTELFSAAERVEMIRSLIAGMDNVSVQAYEGLTFDFVSSVGANVILRGIRDSVDLRGELQTANTNLLVGEVETVFLLTRDQHALTSSSLIRQIAELGGCDEERLGRLVPPIVAKKLQEKFSK